MDWKILQVYILSFILHQWHLAVKIYTTYTGTQECLLLGREPRKIDQRCGFVPKFPNLSLISHTGIYLLLKSSLQKRSGPGDSLAGTHGIKNTSCYNETHGVSWDSIVIGNWNWWLFEADDTFTISKHDHPIASKCFCFNKLMNPWIWCNVDHMLLHLTNRKGFQSISKGLYNAVLWQTMYKQMKSLASTRINNLTVNLLVLQPHV